MKSDMNRKTMLTITWRSLRRVLLAFIAIGLFAGLCVAYGFFIEPHWLKVRRVTLADKPSVRLIHMSDIHYKGDRKYLQKVVDTINRTHADAVCFTGDLMENSKYLDECMQLLSQINKPVYGVPGNHDVWERLPFDKIRSCFRKTGGDWLNDTNAVALNGRILFLGCSGAGLPLSNNALPAATKRILLCHYPIIADRLADRRFDLILAGHTHGGQVRIPLLSSSIMSYDILPYDRGLFQTTAGPLYVNPGIGSFYLDLRFFCRPEITIVEL